MMAEAAISHCKEEYTQEREEFVIIFVIYHSKEAIC